MRTSPRTKLVYKCSASLSDFGIPQRSDNGVQLHKLKKSNAQLKQPPDLPGVDIEAFLGEFGRDNGSPRELATSKCLDSLLRRLCILVFDVNLANTEVDAGTGGTGNLGLNDGSVLAALLFDVFLDF